MTVHHLDTGQILITHSNSCFPPTPTHLPPSLWDEATIPAAFRETPVSFQQLIAELPSTEQQCVEIVEGLQLITTS